jgi:hypothetical protein
MSGLDADVSARDDEDDESRTVDESHVSKSVSVLSDLTWRKSDLGRVMITMIDIFFAKFSMKTPI